MTFSFFLRDQQRTRRKVNQPKNFGPPPETNFAPQEQRSSCGTAPAPSERIILTIVASIAFYCVILS